jgi:hypothetical protein
MIYLLGIHAPAKVGVEKSTTVLIFPRAGRAGTRNSLGDPPAVPEDTLTKGFRRRAHESGYALFRIACKNAARIENPAVIVQQCRKRANQ